MDKEKNTAVNVEDVKALIEQAKAEAERIVDEAKKSAEAIRAASAAGDEQEAAARAEAERKAEELRARGEEYVEIKLFKDNDKYKDDVFVAVNGENCVIKRGERVRIKRKFAEVLDHSEHQDYETSKLIEAVMQKKKLADL